MHVTAVRQSDPKRHQADRSAHADDGGDPATPFDCLLVAAAQARGTHPVATGPAEPASSDGGGRAAGARSHRAPVREVRTVPDATSWLRAALRVPPGVQGADSAGEEVAYIGSLRRGSR